jgi:hypothetical protein
MASEDSRQLQITSGSVEVRTGTTIEPFLLIVRTGRIFTAHVTNLIRRCDMNEYRRILGVSSK